ncbi:MAG: hypothetical protein AB7I27_09120 [Bacteriovoracaceae bacterium]
MNPIDLIASIHNWFADKDFLWWPFSFLRPEEKEPITFKHTLLMTGCFGGLTFLMFAIFAVANNMASAENLTLTFIFSFLGFFIWFNLITKPLWNRRATKLLK